MLASTNIPLEGRKTKWESRKLHSKRFSYFFSLGAPEESGLSLDGALQECAVEGGFVQQGGEQSNLGSARRPCTCTVKLPERKRRLFLPVYLFCGAHIFPQSVNQGQCKCVVTLSRVTTTGHRCLIRILSLVLSKYIFNSLKIESLIVTLSNVHILDTTARFSMEFCSH